MLFYFIILLLLLYNCKKNNDLTITNHLTMNNFQILEALEEYISHYEFQFFC